MATFMAEISNSQSVYHIAQVCYALLHVHFASSSVCNMLQTS